MLRRSRRVTGGLDLLQVARAAVRIAAGEPIAPRVNAETQTTPPRIVIDLSMTPGSIDSQRAQPVQPRQRAQPESQPHTAIGTPAVAIGTPLTEDTPRRLPIPVVLFAGSTPGIRRVGSTPGIRRVILRPDQMDEYEEFMAGRDRERVQDPLYDREDFIPVNSPSWNEELMAIVGDSDSQESSSFLDERLPVIDTSAAAGQRRVSIYEVGGSPINFTPLASRIRDLEDAVRIQINLRDLMNS